MTNAETVARSISEWRRAPSDPPIHLDNLEVIDAREPGGTDTYYAFAPKSMDDGVWIQAHENDVAELGACV